MGILLCTQGMNSLGYPKYVSQWYHHPNAPRIVEEPQIDEPTPPDGEDAAEYRQSWSLECANPEWEQTSSNNTVCNSFSLFVWLFLFKLLLLILMQMLRFTAPSISIPKTAAAKRKTAEAMRGIANAKKKRQHDTNLARGLLEHFSQTAEDNYQISNADVYVPDTEAPPPMPDDDTVPSRRTQTRRGGRKKKKPKKKKKSNKEGDEEDGDSGEKRQRRKRKKRKKSNSAVSDAADESVNQRLRDTVPSKVTECNVHFPRHREWFTLEKCVPVFVVPDDRKTRLSYRLRKNADGPHYLENCVFFLSFSLSLSLSFLTLFVLLLLSRVVDDVLFYGRVMEGPAAVVLRATSLPGGSRGDGGHARRKGIHHESGDVHCRRR